MINPSLYNLAVLGHPIAHSLSPRLHNHWLEDHNLPGGYIALDVEPENLTETMLKLRALGFTGCNLTLPLKETALSLADIVFRSPEVEQTHAANTVVFTEQGMLLYNTDIQGLKAALARLGCLSLQNTRILLLGAGGAARALLALAASEEAVLTVGNRTTARVEALQRDFESFHFDRIELQEALLPGTLGTFDLIVNASSAWTSGGGLPLPKLDLAGHLVLDLSYSTSGTPFSVWGHDLGARSDDGLPMLVFQAAESFFLWTGCRPNSMEMLSRMGRPLTFDQEN